MREANKLLKNLIYGKQDPLLKDVAFFLINFTTMQSGAKTG